tara:strand:- start:565 stop:1299 length:735 start_codon:yes stop_codon:yes gene_type:complete
MKWDDTGLILSSRRHGDNSLILSVLTMKHGKHSGFVRHKVTKKNSFIYEIGNVLDLTWTGRLEDQLGYYRCELIKSYSYNFFDNPLNLLALNSFCEMQNNFLPERESYKNLYRESLHFLKIVNYNNFDWLCDYIRWELKFLAELGYGIDLTSCAVTGQKEDLSFVSPKTGRAISASAAGVWKKRLLALPRFLVNSNISNIDKSSIIDGINLTSFFLKKHLSMLGLKLPGSRDRFINEIHKINLD